MKLVQEYRIIAVSTQMPHRHNFVLQIVGEGDLLFDDNDSALNLTDHDCQRFDLVSLSQLEGRRLKFTFDLHQVQPNSFLSASFTDIDRTADHVLIDTIERLEIWSPNENEQPQPKVSCRLHLFSDDDDDLHPPTFNLLVKLTPQQYSACTQLVPQSAFEVNLTLLPMKAAERLQRELRRGWTLIPDRAPK